MQHQHAGFDSLHGRLQQFDYKDRLIHVNGNVETSVDQESIQNVRIYVLI